jgi:hypothetical protein
MALNPPITSNFEPCWVEGELFILKRKDIEFEVKVPDMGTFKGKGLLILSTAWIVLVNSKGSGECRSFDLPLANIYYEKFNQPIFGANYYSGNC